MVRRSNQPLQSSVRREKPQPTIALESHPGTLSPLVSLPAELQGIIISYLVQSRDLNHFSCTCKALNAVALPILYHTIELKVPLRCSRLPSLENLLVSTAEGLKHTRFLRIVTKQYLHEDNKYVNLDRVPEIGAHGDVENDHLPEDEDDVQSDNAEMEGESGTYEGFFKIFHPSNAASGALNFYIRLLILKLPSQQLHEFWYTPHPFTRFLHHYDLEFRWDHACSLNTITLSILLKHQGASIHALNFSTTESKKRDLANLKLGSLTTLGMAELDYIDPWATELLTKNHQNLRHLRLGNELDCVFEYAEGAGVDRDESRRFCLTQKFSKALQKKVAALKRTSASVIRLESLSLVGLDIYDFANGLIEPEFDFSSLSRLTLESCSGLDASFPLLMGARDSRRKTKSALGLNTLAIRYENTSNGFLQGLEDFLLSLKPLAHLHVLLEGDYDGAIRLQKVLRVHGKSLRSLVWDERRAPKIQTLDKANIFSPDHENLEVVSRHCSGLEALGISLDWEDIIGSERNHKKIAISISQLGRLQTLNIRNLPIVESLKTWLSIDYMVEGLTTMFLNLIMKNTRTEKALALKTLAIGASTYSSVKVGMGHYTPSKTSTFLQLRIYRVNYDCRYRDSILPKLHLIAKDTPADAWGNAEHLDIFTLYWLDGFLEDYD